MPERILITGGAGFIGSHLADALVADGHDVTLLDNLEPQVHAIGLGELPEGLEPHEERLVFGSVTDPIVLAPLVRDVDVIFHLAALVGINQSMNQIRRYADINTIGSATLLDVITRYPVRKLIVASSMSVYGEGACCGRLTSETHPLRPASIYGITKRDQEEMALVYGNAYRIPTVALRFFNVYGSRQSLTNPYTGVAAIFTACLLAGNPVTIYDDGEQTRDFVHVSDVVQACRLAMKESGADGQAVNVGTGMPTTITHLADVLAAELRFNGACAKRFLGVRRMGDIRHCVADISRIRDLLGYEPRMQLQDGVRELTSSVLVHA